jgi:ligand-binding sensor domain-containing protein
MNPTAPPTKNSSFRFFLFCVSGLLAVTSLVAQTTRLNIKFDNLSIKDGLSQSSPNCIFQDSRGLIWIGTEDGLNKYDGYTFTVYKPETNDPGSISNSRILSIAEDKGGNLWIGTNGGGLNLYNRNSNKFRHFQPGTTGEPSVAGIIISCILSLPNGELWIGTENGLSVFDQQAGKFIDPAREYPALQSWSGTRVQALETDGNSIVFAGTTRGLYLIDTEKKHIEQFVHNPNDSRSLPADAITALMLDKENRLWIGTETGLARMDTGGVFIAVRSSAEKQGNIPAVPVKALLQDDEGSIWIGTYGNGIDIWSEGSQRYVNYTYDYNNPYSLKNNEVLSLFKDFSGIIWVGSNGIDLYNPKKEKFVLYDYVPYTREKLVFRNIHPIYEDGAGVLWVGSKSDGLHVLDRIAKTYSRYFHDPNNVNSLSSSRIRAIREFPEGVLWIGTDDQGLNKVYLDENRKPIRYKRYKHDPANPNSISSNRIYSFYTDHSGKLWIGTDNGLTIMDTESESFTQYLPDTANANSLSNTTVYSIFGDKAGNIWLATDYGVNKFDPVSGGFRHYIHQAGDDNSLIYNEILSFCENPKGLLWIGTYGKGLDQFDPVTGTFKHFNDIPELSMAVIYGILEDETGKLWLSTNNGILKFNPSTGETNQFSIEDGLQSNEFNGTSYFKSSSGEMFFGGQYGFNSFFPNEVEIDSIPPRIILSDLQVRNQSLLPGKDSPIKIHINEVKEIILDYEQNNFTLYFSALHYANPELNQYKYKLEGFDDEWIEVGNKRFVSYTSLPYKSYTFRVIASNSDGVWNEQGLSVKIRIKPPFWATLWFRILLIIALIWGVVFLVRQRLHAAQKQKQIIEEKFESSSLELEEARKQLEIQHDEIVIQKRELKLREKDQENLLWFNQGLGIFSDIFSKNRNDLKQLCHVTLEKLVEYVDAQQGGIFLLNDEKPEEPFLELIAHYAFTSDKAQKRFNIGEGYVGACFFEKRFIEIDNLTEDYACLRSGLGSEYLKHLLLAPLKINEECVGVVELGSFRKIKGYRISFVEKLMETFAAIIHTEMYSARLKQLIEQSNLQSKELEASEEQLRMNLEEIMATQEESARREDELIKLAEESATREEMLSQEIEMLKLKIEEQTGNAGGS